MSKECIECRKPATEDHHVIPRVLGGTVTVPLCGGCHALVHGGYNKRRDDHVELTKEGIKRARERGVILGNRTNLEEAQQLSRDALIAKANQFAMDLKDVLLPLKEAGMTLQEIASHLNATGVRTSRGKNWHTTTVCNMFKRFKILQDASSGSTQTEQTSGLPVVS